MTLKSARTTGTTTDTADGRRLSRAGGKAPRQPRGTAPVHLKPTAGPAAGRTMQSASAFWKDGRARAAVSSPEAPGK